jgi:hypothetical protein
MLSLSIRRKKPKNTNNEFGAGVSPFKKEPATCQKFREEEINLERVKATCITLYFGFGITTVLMSLPLR